MSGNVFVFVSPEATQASNEIGSGKNIQQSE